MTRDELAAAPTAVRQRYVAFMLTHLGALDLALRNATPEKIAHWREVTYAALIKHAAILNAMPFAVSAELSSIIHSVKALA